jgi:hypothetical protein
MVFTGTKSNALTNQQNRAVKNDLTDEQMQQLKRVITSWSINGVSKLESFFRNLTSDCLNPWGKRIEITSSRVKNSFRNFCRDKIQEETNPEKLKSFLNELLSHIYFHYLLNKILLGIGELDDLSQEQKMHFEVLKQCVIAEYVKTADKNTRGGSDFLKPMENFSPNVADLKTYIKTARKALQALPQSVLEIVPKDKRNSIAVASSLIYENIKLQYEEPAKMRCLMMESFFDDEFVAPLKRNKYVLNVEKPKLSGLKFDFKHPASEKTAIVINPSFHCLLHLVNLQRKLLLTDADFQKLSKEVEDAFNMYEIKRDPQRLALHNRALQCIAPSSETLQEKLFRIENSKTPLRDTIEPIKVVHSLRELSPVENDPDEETDEEKFEEELMAGNPDVTICLSDRKVSFESDTHKNASKQLNSEDEKKSKKRVLSSNNEANNIIQSVHKKRKTKLHAIDHAAQIAADDNSATYQQENRELLSPVSDLSDLSDPLSNENDDNLKTASVVEKVSDLSGPLSTQDDEKDPLSNEKDENLKTPSVVEKVDGFGKIMLPDCCANLYFIFFKCMKKSSQLASECFDAVRACIEFANTHRLCLFRLKQSIIALLHKVCK